MLLQKITFDFYYIKLKSFLKCKKFIFLQHNARIDGDYNHTKIGYNYNQDLIKKKHHIFFYIRAPKYFDSDMDGIKRDAGSNWMLRLNNLKKLSKNITTFYQESLLTDITLDGRLKAFCIMIFVFFFL